MEIRQIRNENREFLTGNDKHIGWLEQAYFWLRQNPLYSLYVGKILDAVVGYGAVRLDERKAWLTGVVSEDWQGEGLGRQMFTFLSTVAPKPVYLDVFRSNIKALTLYRSLGFVVVSKRASPRGLILTMRQK
jgi:ribosomal protein S18 acetylase RimI-like enzyme